MNVGSLAQLLGQAVQPEVGRRYPAVGNAPMGYNMPGEVVTPQELPNPYHLKHLDPIERDWIRPTIMLDTYPWAT